MELDDVKKHRRVRSKGNHKIGVNGKALKNVPLLEEH